MVHQFKFRKYVAPSSYAGVSDPPLFTNAVGYSAFNSATESGVIANTWNNAIVLSAPMTDQKTQDYFSREWVEEDGIDVYIPNARKRKSAKNEIEMLIYEQSNTAISNLNTIIDKLNSWGVFEYYDNYNRVLKRLVYDGYDTILNRARDVDVSGTKISKRVIHFKINCTNVLGYDKLFTNT